MYFKKKAAATPPAGNSDSFTDTNGVHLADHNANWAGYGDVGLDNITIQGNKASGTTYVSTWARYTSSTADTSQIVMSAYTDNASINPSIGVMVRGSSTSKGYVFKLFQQDGTNWTYWELDKNGSWADSAAGQTFAGNTSHILKITASGTSSVVINMYVDGNLIHSYTDSSSPIGSGNPGFFVISDAIAMTADDWTDTP